MRACWIDFGNDADYVRLHEHGITEPIYDIRDPRITKPYLDEVRSHGLEPGVYACWNWPETKDLSGPKFADWVDARVKPLQRSATFPSVHLNDETHDPLRIIALLERWRILRPSKKTLWTFEGMQGGLFTRPQAKAVNATNVLYGSQCYTGQMSRLESATVALDLVTHGFVASRIQPFLDAAALGYWWAGTAYTQGRLP